MKGFKVGEVERLGVEGVEGDLLIKGLELFEKGDILDDTSMKGFTFDAMELLGVDGVGGDPVMKGFKLFGIGDILGDPSMQWLFTSWDKELLGDEGVEDWLSEAVGDKEGDA